MFVEKATSQRSFQSAWLSRSILDHRCRPWTSQSRGIPVITITIKLILWLGSKVEKRREREKENGLSLNSGSVASSCVIRNSHLTSLKQFSQMGPLTRSVSETAGQSKGEGTSVPAHRTLLGAVPVMGIVIWRKPDQQRRSHWGKAGPSNPCLPNPVPSLLCAWEPQGQNEVLLPLPDFHFICT